MLKNYSNETISRRRIYSGKASSSNSRPISGSTNKLRQKTEALQSIYSGISTPLKRQKTKHLIYGVLKTELIDRQKREQLPITTKTKEEVFEENMMLKRQNNKLQEDFIILKGKQANKKKTNKKDKQLDIQFEKQIYWAGSKSHLISGVKHQYEKLQAQLKEKTRECEQLKISLMESKVPEYKIYSQNLQFENKRLIDRLEKMISLNRSQMSMKEEVRNNSFEEENYRRKMEQKMEKLKRNISEERENLKQKEKKISFLEKLIIEKDNNEFHSLIKRKKAEKLLHEMKEQNLKQKKNSQNLKKQNETKIQQIEAKLFKEAKEEKESLLREIQEKDLIIKEQAQDKKNLQNAINRLKISVSIASLGQSGVQFEHLKNSNIEEFEDLVKSLHFSTFSPKKEEVETEDKTQKNQKRMVKRATQRHSQNAKKVKKIDYESVKGIGELMKYRLIGKQIPGSKIKQLLAFDSPEKQDQTAEWDREYISLKEVIKKLQAQPVLLDEQQSERLGRYLIEDGSEDFVYFDEENENKRQIVKSILKSIVGEYELNNREEEEEYFQQTFSKYKEGMKQTLEKAFPHKNGPMEKIVKVLKGLELEIEDRFYEVLMWKLCLKSNSIDELDFGKIFI